jgi:hypothetical protein
MPKETPEEWINAHDASLILSKNSKRDISADYVRLLANKDKIRSKSIDRRTKLYSRIDIEAYTVRKKSKPEQMSSGS